MISFKVVIMKDTEKSYTIPQDLLTLSHALWDSICIFRS
jgi:hypothetical protein